MKRLLICLALLSTCIGASAQMPKKTTDSLVALLNSNPSLEQRVAILKKLSDKQNDALVILKYAKEGIALCKNANRLKNEEFFLSDLGNGYAKAEDAPNMIATDMEGLELSKGLKDNEYICLFLNGLSVGYNAAGETRKGIAYGLTGLEFAKKAGIKDMLPRFYSNIGGYYIKLNLLDSAEIYTKKSLEVLPKEQAGFRFFHMNNLGLIEYRRGHYAKALAYYYQSVPLIIKLKFLGDPNLITTYSRIGDVYLKTGPADSAFLYFNKAFTIAQKDNYLSGIQRAALGLATLYESKNISESYRYYKIAMAAKDSLKGTEKAKQVQLILFKQQEQQTEAKDAAAAYQAKLKLYGMLLVLALVITIAIVMYNSNKKQKAANKQLQRQQEELKAAQAQLIQSEKMASLGELTAGIAHEIQNPLNFVNNFSEVSAEMIDELDEELAKGDVSEAKAIAEDIKQNLEKIRHHGKRADFIVKGMLEHSRTSTGQKEPTDLNKLAEEYLRLAYHGLCAKDKSFNADVVTHFDKKLPAINVIPQDIGRVLVNLFNNAFYAVDQKMKTAAPDYKPTVEVATSTGDGRMMISVRDNGNGIPENIKDKIMQPFFTTKPTGEGTGLGLSLSYDIVVKGHNGTISVDTKENEFTQFNITLPLTL